MTKAIEPKNSTGSTKLSVLKESASFAAAVRQEAGTIAGIDDHSESRYRFPRLGKVHLGVKKQFTRKKPNGDTYTVEAPDKTDYFVLPDALLQDAKFRAVLEGMGENPDKPRKLPVQLVSHMMPDNMRSSLDLYGKNRGLKCRSFDGIVRQCVNESTGEMIDGKCPNAECPQFKSGDCQLISRLRFFLPDAQGVGVWQIDSRSKNNRANLACEMGTIRSACGQLAGIDLLLTLEPEEKVITLPGKGNNAPSQQKVIVFLLHLRTDLTLRELKVAAEAAKRNVTWTTSDVEEVDTSYDDVVMTNSPDTPDDFMAGIHGNEPMDAELVEPEEPQGLREELTEECRRLLNAKSKTPVLQKSLIASAVGGKAVDAPALEDCSLDQLTAIRDLLVKAARANEPTD